MSPYGYETIVGIVGADDVLSQSQPADRMGWSEDNYWLVFFGDSSDLVLSQRWKGRGRNDGVWLWRRGC